MGVGGVRGAGGLLDDQGEVQDDMRADREPFGEAAERENDLNLLFRLVRGNGDRDAYAAQARLFELCHLPLHPAVPIQNPPPPPPI